jgi:hypothetical protein
MRIALADLGLKRLDVVHRRLTIATVRAQPSTSAVNCFRPTRAIE